MNHVRRISPFAGRCRKALMLLAVPAAAAAAMAGPVAASARTQAPAGGPGHWSEVVPSGNDIIRDIGLVRGSDGVLHVLWTGGHSTSQTIYDTPISANGTVHAKEVVASGWYIASDPDATVTGSGLAVFWNGDQTGVSSGPHGTFEATRPRSGGNWSLVSAPIPPITAAPYDSLSDSAGPGADGQPWVGFSGTNSLIVDHLGHPEVQISPDKCCLYQQAFATDGKSGQTWVAYSSLITGDQGLFVRKLQVTGHPAGKAILMPGSRVRRNTIEPEQRVAITGRGKGKAGVYVAYGAGWPFLTSLDVLRLGAHTPVKLGKFGDSPELTGTALTADPKGRLWVTWFVNGTKPGLFARRSGTTGTKFGKTARIPLPAGTTTVWKAYINAQAGRLDVVVLLTKHNNEKTTAYWATQVKAPR